jgi:hypothetical protein
MNSKTELCIEVTWTGETDGLTGTGSPGIEFERFAGIELESLLAFFQDSHSAHNSFAVAVYGNDV